MNKTINKATQSTKTRRQDEVLIRFSKKNCTLNLSALGIFPALRKEQKISCRKEKSPSYQETLRRWGDQRYFNVAMKAATFLIASSLAKVIAMGLICIPYVSPLFVPRVPALKFFNCRTTYQSCRPVSLGEFKAWLPPPVGP